MAEHPVVELDDIAGMQRPAKQVANVVPCLGIALNDAVKQAVRFIRSQERLAYIVRSVLDKDTFARCKPGNDLVVIGGKSRAVSFTNIGQQAEQVMRAKSYRQERRTMILSGEEVRSLPLPELI